MTSSTHRWGPPLHQHNTDTTNNIGSEGDSASSKKTPNSPNATSLVLPSATSAWATLSSTKKSNITEEDTPEPESKNPLSPKPKNELTQGSVSHHAKPAEIPMPFTQGNELSTMSWDEMVSEELEFAESVLNHDNGTDDKQNSTSLEGGDNGDDEGSQQYQQHVSPSDHHDSYNNDRSSYGKWNSERRGSGHTTNYGGYSNHGRQSSNGSNHSTTSPIHQRRPSQEQHSASSPTITTLLRRPHDNDTSSLYNAKDDRPPDIVAAQRKAMTTAAELAKKRREADEAERQAAAERARQKALALAPPPPPPKQEEAPPKASVTILTHTRPQQPNIKPGTILTTTTANTGTGHLHKTEAEMTEDEKSWADYVSKIKENTSSDGNNDDQNNTPTTTVNDWSSFAVRLQRSSEPKRHGITTTPSLTEQASANTKTDDQQQSADNTMENNQPLVDTESSKSPSPSITSTEVQTGPVTDDPSLITNDSRRILKSSSKLRHYPIFPGTIGRMVPPKPASLQFMIDPAESDDELMCILEQDSEENESESVSETTQPTEPEPVEHETVKPLSPDAPSPVEREPVEPKGSSPVEPMITTVSSPSPPPPTEPVQSPETNTSGAKEEIPVNSNQETDTRKGLYPEGLPNPGSFFTPTQSSAAQLIVPSDIGHNENYPLLMFPMRSPLSCKNGSSPLVVRLLPPGPQQSKMMNDLSSYGIK
ncbi:hypothetical protein BC941DRAFT_89122 [Chlamydoabsidia padenii]|nr:hypothetical protein BC941DRAFT_89122 [Chlamydoabsidia padenii]